MSHTQRIAANLARVQGRIAAAVQQSGRAADAVRIVAITKGHPAEAVRALLDLGVADIGESYVDEALPKQEALAGQGRVQWHMVGHVQSRKARDVAQHFSMVHSLDSLKLAERLARFAGEAGLQLPVLLECNVSAEASKYGWDVTQDADAFVADAEAIARLEHLQLRGLMSMAPVVSAPAEARPYFERTRRLRDELAGRLGAELSELSMGMSDDFEAAILEGATLLRIGTALLGPRVD